MNRRKFIKVMASGALASTVVYGAGKWAVGADLDQARQPWLQAGNYQDVRLFALSYAILAPNPHNLQPWAVKLVADDQFILFADETLKLPGTDPFERQLTIGLGCFLELLSISAKQRGFATKIELFPEGQSPNGLTTAPVAKVKFNKLAQPQTNDLFTSILARRSIKTAYSEQLPDAQSIAELSSNININVTTNATQVKEVRELTWQAMNTEMHTPSAMAESIEYSRIGNNQIVANPDGIALGGAGLSIMQRLGLLTHESLADPESMAFKSGVSMQKDIFMGTHAYLWITSAGNDRLAQIQAGRDYARTNLIATKLGLAMHPVSQALQEYQEVQGFYAPLAQALAVRDGTRIQMLARLGYANTVEPSPRRSLEQKLI